jgi:hypothetical protein
VISAREHINRTKGFIAISAFGGLLLAAALNRWLGAASLLIAVAGVAFSVVLAVRGVAAARAANVAAHEERWGVLGLTPEPHGIGGGLRHRGTYGGRVIDTYHVGTELYLAVGAGTRGFAAITGPRRALGESLDLPAMHVLPPLPGLPPAVQVLAQDPAAVARWLATPGVQDTLLAIFAAARMPDFRRVWVAPGGVMLRDVLANLQEPEVAHRTIDQVILLAAAAEQAGI